MKVRPLPPNVDNGGKPQVNGKDLLQTADYREKQVALFTCLSCGGADGLTGPVAVASQIFFFKEQPVYN
jgi:hypothetical protein